MEPWEIKEDDTRKVDTQRVFIIFCEDSAIEPAYFNMFKHEGIRLSTHGNTKQHHAQVDHTTEFFSDKDLLEIKNGKEVLKIDDGTQVWCVFDRDKEPNDRKDNAFNDSIQNANEKGIQTAWSNDDFELWVLLHFEDIDPNDTDYSNRTKYYERLTDILKQQYPNEAKFQHANFDYYKTMKSKKNFIYYTYLKMKDNIEIAITRAEKLESHHNTPNSQPPHLQCPCTRVHHLVKELRK